MNKEEKEAIEEVKKIINYIEDNYTCNCDREDKEYMEKVLNYIDKLQKKEEQSQDILSCIKIAYQVHTKDCELLLKDIKKWEKMLDK